MLHLRDLEVLPIRPCSTPRRRPHGPRGSSGQQPHPRARRHARPRATRPWQRAKAPAPRGGHRQCSRRWVPAQPARPGVADAPRGTHTWRIRPQPRPCRLHSSAHPSTSRRQLHPAGLRGGAHALLLRPPAPCDPQRRLWCSNWRRGRDVPAGSAALRPHTTAVKRRDASWWGFWCLRFRACRTVSSWHGSCEGQQGRGPGRDGGGAVEPHAWPCAWGGRWRWRRKWCWRCPGVMAGTRAGARAWDSDWGAARHGAGAWDSGPGLWAAPRSCRLSASTTPPAG